MNTSLMPASSTDKPFKILLVDDESGQRMLQKDILSSDSFIVSEVNDGRAALREISRNDFDVILLDKNMPDMKGDEVCKTIRGDMNDLLLPIIMVTGTAGGEELIQSFDAGATDYIQKPYAPSELIARVTKAAKHKKLLDQLEDVNSIYPAIVGIIEARDGRTARHCQRVSANCILFARYIGLDDDSIKLLELLATFHDVGKLSIPDHILKKKESLTVCERKIMEMHSIIGAEFCTAIKSLSSLSSLVRHHHENWDGSGYPDGLSGETTPYLVRVFQLLDIYDSLADESFDSVSLQHVEIIKYIKDDEVKFDVHLAELFVEFIKLHMDQFHFPPQENSKNETINGMQDLIQREVALFEKIPVCCKENKRENISGNIDDEGLEQQFMAVLETTTVGLFGLDLEGKVTFVNTAACNILGHKKSDLLGFVHHDVVHHSLPDGQVYESKNCPMHHCLCTGESMQGEELFFHKSGESIPIDFSCSPIFREGMLSGAVITFQDMRKKIEADKELQLAVTVFDNSHEAMLITDRNKNILKVNRAFTQITGFYEQDVVGRPPIIFQSHGYSGGFTEDIELALLEKGAWHGEIYNKTRNGDKFTALLNINCVKDVLGEITNYVGIFSDVTTIKQAHEEIERIAHHDPLTGLPNRLLFNKRLKIAVDHATRGKYLLAILFIDLDRFKDINDSLGHSAGDQLLMEVAKRIKYRVRKEDVVARLGGDEFVVLLGHIDEPDDAAKISKKLMKSLEEPMMLDNHALVLTMSIGISVFPRDANDTDKLIRNADAAMYHAKECGFNGYHFYDKEMTKKAEEQMFIEVLLRKAIENNEFELYYQPQVNLMTGALTGTEALIRWNCPEQGLLSPLQFIHVAESSGLIVPIGEWVFHTACKQARLWLDKGIDFGHIAVNVSGVQIQREGLLDVVKSSLKTSDLDSKYLELEITESSIMHDTEKNMTLLHNFKDLGVIISIDDFGTGFSSLSYLQTLPVDKLKIDRAFVKNLPNNRKDAAIVKTIVALCKGLDLNVVAEGIETEAQHLFLKSHDCIEGQGWLYGKAVSADDFEDFCLAMKK